MENVVRVPLWGEQLGGILVNERSNDLEEGLRIWVLNDTASDDDHWLLSSKELLSESTGKGLLESSDILSELLILKGGIEILTNNTNLEVRSEPLLADTSVQNGSLVSWVGSDKEDSISLLDTGDLGVEGVVGTDVDAVGEWLISLWLIEGQVLRVESVGEILRGDEGLDFDELTGNNLELVLLWRNLLVTGTDLLKGLLPGSWEELVTLSDQRSCESLCPQSITGEARLVINPFLVDIIVQAWDNSHNLESTRIDSDSRAEGVVNIDRLGLLQFPRTSAEGVWFRSKSTDGAEIDDVSGHLGVEMALEVSSDLNVVSTSS